MTIFSLRKLLTMQIMALGCTSFVYADSPPQKKNEESSVPSTKHSAWILDYVHPIEDFSNNGVQFQWYAHLLRQPAAFARVISEFAERYRNSKVEAIAGLDSRGFIFGAALAYELKIPFILIQKQGKIPGSVEKMSKESAYGGHTLEMEKDSIKAGQRVLIVGDVLASGATASAACTLIERLGGKVEEVACVIELPMLKGRSKISSPVFSLVAID